MYKNKKSTPKWSAFFLKDVQLLCKRSNAYIALAGCLLSEDNYTINKCEEGVVLAHTNILTWVVNSTALTNDDVACLRYLTTIKLYAESFAL